MKNKSFAQRRLSLFSSMKSHFKLSPLNFILNVINKICNLVSENIQYQNRIISNNIYMKINDYYNSYSVSNEYVMSLPTKSRYN